MLIKEIDELQKVNRKLAEDLAVVENELDSLGEEEKYNAERKDDVIDTLSQETISKDKLIADLRQENCHLEADKNILTQELNKFKKSLLDKSESYKALQENIEKLTSEAEKSKIVHEKKLDTMRQEYKSEVREMNRAIKLRDVELVELQEKLIL